MYAFRFRNINSLEYGDSGEDVILLQEKLKILGFFPFGVDGSYGAATEDAVKDFQKDNDLEVTGVANADTLTLLYDKTDTVVFGNTNYPTIKIGSRGEDVLRLQRQLSTLYYFNYEATGYFGRITEKAVKKFQSNNRLTADGIVGRNTWNLLDLLYAPLATCNNGDTVTSTYIVKKGDTLYAIARKFNTTVSEIKKLNNLQTDIIQIGQVLKIPSKENNVYIVEKGDTLYAIARKFNTTVAEIKRKNNLQTNIIQIGQEIII